MPSSDALGRAEVAGYPYCTTSQTGTCEPCPVAGSSDVPCRTGDDFGADPAICTAYFSPNYPTNFGGADKCSSTGGATSTAWRTEVYVNDPSGSGADMTVGELQAWEDTSGFMVVGFLSECPYVLDLRGGATSPPLVLTVTDTALGGGGTQGTWSTSISSVAAAAAAVEGGGGVPSGGGGNAPYLSCAGWRFQIRGTGAGQLAGAACSPYRRTVTLSAALVQVAPAGPGVCSVVSSAGAASNVSLSLTYIVTAGVASPPPRPPPSPGPPGRQPLAAQATLRTAPPRAP
ncbi:hypothetical protein HYH02_014571 [Chlamydomonas schloesseri]|uniref:Uncharacterized protein n=1 Tax=Chlamydomonas schloesseri TaxID=2026947 RepID=A0A835VTS4_9CHLO|nr:hypothetical protein HYH02_014571 [Chlamydomonas schloesseri]|eukprot:KAG2427525.1 hypothetical protein HYH02_014571 [Chlamydomonas schloesseri]